MSLRAKIYDDRFAGVFPIDWEVHILDKYLLARGSVLDVGCGTGRHVVSLAQKGLDIVGIDRDEEFVAVAHGKLKLGRLSASLVLADALKLPVREGAFDCVISMGNALGDAEIREVDRQEMLDEMRRVLKLEGTLIIELVHRYWRATDLLRWAWRYADAVWQRLCGKPTEYGDYAETIGGDRLTFHAFTTKESQRLLESQGLTARIEKRGRFFHDWFIVVGSRFRHPLPASSL